MIQYIAENVKMPALRKQRINRWIKEIADGYGKKTGNWGA